jgi:hypothetical protein
MNPSTFSPTQKVELVQIHSTEQYKSFIAIASMRTGNESELGTIHELLLDWNVIPPRAPDDVVVGDRH